MCLRWPGHSGFSQGCQSLFGGECVLAATYLINRLPSRAVENQTPYERLFGKPADYSTLRVFGCLAVAYNPNLKHDKFEPRGVPCLFIGYPSSQKGYKLLNMLTKQKFVTRHVKFFEHIMPYHQDRGEFLHQIPHNHAPNETLYTDGVNGEEHVQMEGEAQQENHDTEPEIGVLDQLETEEQVPEIEQQQEEQEV